MQSVPITTDVVDRISQWLSTGRWFYSGSLVSSTNKTDHHDITEILFKVTLSTITLTLKHFIFISVTGLTSIVSPELPPNLEPQPLPLFGDRYSGIMEDISVSFLKLDWQKLVYLLYMYHLCKMDYVHLTWKIVFAMKMKYVTKQRVHKTGLYNATKTLAFASYFCKMRV